MVETTAVCIEAGDDATEALEAGDLPEHKSKELVTAGEVAYLLVSVIFLNEGIEFVITDTVCQLRENVTV